MFAKVKAFGLSGIEGFEVQVEADLYAGLPGTDFSGLLDAANKEAKERVKSAIKNSGFLFTPRRITLNLAPADTKKEGPIFDLAIALAIMAAYEQLPIEAIKDNDTVFIGELSLDGKLRGVRGMLPLLISAVQKGHTRFVIPKDNEKEASFIENANIFAFSSLREVVNFLYQPKNFTPIKTRSYSDIPQSKKFKQDFKYIRGQAFARRAAEIAVAGNHNILLVGPPGSGKSMLAKCLPSIMPDMTAQESIETTKIHSIAGLLLGTEGIVVERPFRAPHHTASRIAVTGGGAKATPGEISLAHNGVLFLDELPEYPRNVLEILRQPLEDKFIMVSRANRMASYPCDFMLVSGMNPCPCGNLGSEVKECICTPAQINKYMSRLSGPLLDRIDMHIEVDNVTYDDLKGAEGEESAAIRERVNAARRIQNERYKGLEASNNAQMNPELLKQYCTIDERSEQLVKIAFEKLGLSVRAYTRVLKVARTIADLDASKHIEFNHISEAISYRCLDKRK